MLTLQQVEYFILKASISFIPVPQVFGPGAAPLSTELAQFKEAQRVIVLDAVRNNYCLYYALVLYGICII